jgi:hypothetical protein
MSLIAMPSATKALIRRVRELPASAINDWKLVAYGRNGFRQSSPNGHPSQPSGGRLGSGRQGQPPGKTEAPPVNLPTMTVLLSRKIRRPLRWISTKNAVPNGETRILAKEEPPPFPTVPGERATNLEKLSGGVGDRTDRAGPPSTTLHEGMDDVLKGSGWRPHERRLSRCVVLD